MSSTIHTGDALTFGSVCSGVEAPSQAWEPLGFVPVWFAEIEPFPSAVLAHHWPHVPNLGDMTTIAGRVRSREIVAPDVLVGGTPCQSFSVAGLRGGLTDGRGQLILAFLELANAIDDIRHADGLPSATIVWENVPGVLSDDTNAFGCFLSGLAGGDEPLVHPDGGWPGSGVVLGPRRWIAWRTLDAQYFDLAQRRERVFVVASAGGVSPCEVLFEREGVQRYSAPSRGAGEDVAGTLRAGSGGGCGPGPDEARQGLLHVEGPAPTLVGGGRKRGGFSEDDVPHTAVFGCDLSQRAEGIVFREGLCPTLAPGTHPGHGAHLVCATGSITHTLMSEGYDGSEDGNGRGTPITAVPVDITNQTLGEHVSGTLEAAQDRGNRGHGVMLGWAVRRFIPRECERLQGMRPGHTLIPWRGKPINDCPDGPRYKAIGNSMAVNVMAWIGKRIAAEVRSRFTFNTMEGVMARLWKGDR